MWSAQGESFDPRLLRKTVSDAGFSAPEVEITVSGKLVSREEDLYLETGGPVTAFLLRGGEVVEALRGKEDLVGQRLRLRGQLHASHADQPPGLAVEEWKMVEPEAETD